MIVVDTLLSGSKLFLEETNGEVQVDMIMCSIIHKLLFFPGELQDL